MEIMVLGLRRRAHRLVRPFVDQVQPCEYDLVYLPANLTLSDRVAEQMSIAFLQQAVAEDKPSCNG
jgi:hypothetical protein